MKDINKPIWIFIVNTFPSLILIMIFAGEFYVIKSLLPKDSLMIWKLFGLLFIFLSLINIIYAGYLVAVDKSLSMIYTFAALIAYIAFLYAYGYHIDLFFPRNIPQWMLPEGIVLYAGTFLMPSLAYFLFNIVYMFSLKYKNAKIWKSISVVVGIPLSFYIFSIIILPLWKPIEKNYFVHVIIVAVIILTLVFSYFFIRIILLVLEKRTGFFIKYRIIWKIIVSIIFPVAGLVANNGIALFGITESKSGIFGDFNNPWFYIMAVINGAVICMPVNNNFRYRTVLFIARCLFLPFSLYFFLVFLPFLPFSVIAITLAGTGFLMLTPSILIIMHIYELSADYSYMNNFLSKIKIVVIFSMSFMIIPLVITSSFIHDKSTLNETLDYIYSPDYTKKYSIDLKSLIGTISAIKMNKERNWRISGSRLPYISSFYNWIVLDNLTLSTEKINMIESIFFNGKTSSMASDDLFNSKVEISSIISETSYNDRTMTYSSIVHFVLSNNSSLDFPAEFAEVINLQEGCWIKGYYLYVGNKKETGVLAEKRSATWIYSQIVNTNRDPGIIYYLTGNRIALRVFPFAPNEVRKTGVEIIHKGPAVISVAGKNIYLGGKPDFQIKDSGDALYLSAEDKNQLRSIKRKPYFHFLIDSSKGKEKYKFDFLRRIKKFTASNPEMSANARISFANYYVHSRKINVTQEDFSGRICSGGFFLDRAIRKAIVNSYGDKYSYPVFIVVTNNINDAVIIKDFSDLSFAYPENTLFYVLNHDGKAERHSLWSNPKSKLREYGIDKNLKGTLEYRIGKRFFIIPDNKEPSVIAYAMHSLSKDIVVKDEFLAALTMRGMWMNLSLSPHKKEVYFRLMQYSFSSRIMSPSTSYVVVENEAQKAALLRKQKQILSGNIHLDSGDEAVRMSEPGLLIVIVALTAAIWKLRRLNAFY